ncbi:hypothetical protein EV188_101888 [Actinomycetospora succinea]|uniref:Uncharacterized protein n=1 Tax=Actinomycetospora succinea TaxID=663603 RepID=A0A4R6VSN6_9PSEU|nr:hypothetical protein [Actinomycetospora succinea]TDQ65636.1 hypothetical protein EV188_101888 [Actinomycetospora succinea]
MDPDQARRLVAAEPTYEWGFQEGRTCSVCGANILSPDRDPHTRWHRALAELLGVGWEDLAARAPADDELAAAVDAVVNPRGLRRLSRIATAGVPWRAIPDVPLGEDGVATLLVGTPGVVVARAAPGRVEVRGGVVHVGGHRTALADSLRGAVGVVRAALGRESLRVWGVVVGLEGLTGGDPDPSEVLAAAGDGLADRLAMLPEALGYGELESVYDLARRSSTWR